MTDRTTPDHPPVCDYEGSDYQSEFWDQGGREYEDGVEEIALKRLLPAHGEILLETGAGAGRNTSRYGGFEHIVLLDYSMSQLQKAQQRLGKRNRYTYVAADIYRLPFTEGVFDAATMIRTLHHMADPALALREVRNSVKQDGIFILEYANKKNIKAIARYLLRKQEWNPFTHEPVEFVKLNYNFHPEAIRTWLEACDFSVERQLTVSHFRVGVLKRLIPNKLLIRLDSLAQLTGDWWQVTPSVFVRSRAVGDTPHPASESIFRCPVCDHYPLETQPNSLICTSCANQWKIDNGIYDFRKPMNQTET